MYSFQTNCTNKTNDVSLCLIVHNILIVVTSMGYLHGYTYLVMAHELAHALLFVMICHDTEFKFYSLRFVCLHSKV